MPEQTEQWYIWMVVQDPYVRLFEHGSERLRTRSDGVGIQNYLYTFASNGRSGHIQADTNGFMRVTGSHAGVGLCMSNADNEVFRIHKESWGAQVYVMQVKH